MEQNETTTAPHRSQENANDFLTQATDSRRGLVREFIDLLATTKKWWLVPAIIAIVLLGVLVFLSGTAAAPFMYTLF